MIDYPEEFSVDGVTDEEGVYFIGKAVRIPEQDRAHWDDLVGCYICLARCRGSLFLTVVQLIDPEKELSFKRVVKGQTPAGVN